MIRDHICGGTATALAVMLGPNSEPAAWDSFHICDPSVVAGRFQHGSVIYRYAMFYLGNDVDASRNNQIGLALTASLDGPWVRYAPPIVSDVTKGVWGIDAV